jgi:hypothetical protein
MGLANWSVEAVKVGWSIAVEMGVPQLAATVMPVGTAPPPAAQTMVNVGLLAIKAVAGAEIPVAMARLTVVAAVVDIDAVAVVNVTAASPAPVLAPAAVNVVVDPVTVEVPIVSAPLVKM